MSKRRGELREGPEAEREAVGHCASFKPQAVTPEATLLRLTWPGMNATQIAQDLGNRISPSNVRQWRSGLRPISPWVIEEVRKRHAAAAHALDQIKTGPGTRAGWNNLNAWRAAQNLER